MKQLNAQKGNLLEETQSSGFRVNLPAVMMSSLVPRPRSAFRHFQYGKAIEGLVSFLVSDVRIERRVDRV